MPALDEVLALLQGEGETPVSMKCVECGGPINPNGDWCEVSDGAAVVCSRECWGRFTARWDDPPAPEGETPKERELRSWNESVAVCPRHTRDIVERGGCVICDEEDLSERPDSPEGDELKPEWWPIAHWLNESRPPATDTTKADEWVDAKKCLLDMIERLRSRPIHDGPGDEALRLLVQDIGIQADDRGGVLVINGEVAATLVPEESGGLLTWEAIVGYLARALASPPVAPGENAREMRHCHVCGETWVDTGDDVCPHCGSKDTEGDWDEPDPPAPGVHEGHCTLCGSPAEIHESDEGTVSIVGKARDTRCVECGERISVSDGWCEVRDGAATVCSPDCWERFAARFDEAATTEEE